MTHLQLCGIRVATAYRCCCPSYNAKPVSLYVISQAFRPATAERDLPVLVHPHWLLLGHRHTGVYGWLDMKTSNGCVVVKIPLVDATAHFSGG